MYIVPIAWMFVVLLMTVAEATSTQGTVLGAFFTFVLYGLVPLAIVMYLMGTPSRRRARKQAESADRPTDLAGSDGDGSSHAAGAGVTPEREKP
jgi:hypothetical protein